MIEFIFSASCCWIAGKECLRAHLRPGRKNVIGM